MYMYFLLQVQFVSKFSTFKENTGKLLEIALNSAQYNNIENS